MAPLKHKQPHKSSSRIIPAIVPMTIPAIAPPLSPPPPVEAALAPIKSAPFVPTGAVNPSVVVGAEVCVTVDAPLLVPRTPGVASPVASVPVAMAEELSATHSPSKHSWVASQQVLPHLVSAKSTLQVPVDEPVAAWARLLHTEVMVDLSVSVTT